MEKHSIKLWVNKTPPYHLTLDLVFSRRTLPCGQPAIVHLIPVVIQALGGHTAHAPRHPLLIPVSSSCGEVDGRGGFHPGIAFLYNMTTKLLNSSVSFIQPVSKPFFWGCLNLSFFFLPWTKTCPSLMGPSDLNTHTPTCVHVHAHTQKHTPTQTHRMVASGRNLLWAIICQIFSYSLILKHSLDFDRVTTLECQSI